MLLGCDRTYAPFCVSQFPLNLLKVSASWLHTGQAHLLQGPCVPTSVLLSVSWWQRYRENGSEWRSSTATPLTTPTHNHIHVLILMIYEYFCTCSILNEGGIMSNVHSLNMFKLCMLQGSEALAASILSPNKVQCKGGTII